MKKFQKISDELFQAIPESKLNAVLGGNVLARASLTDIFSTGDCECVDANDVDRPNNADF